MPTSMPAYTTALPRTGKPRFYAWRIAFLLLILALVLLAEPRVFQAVLKRVLIFEAWRQGGHARIERVAGSFFEPVRLYDARWSFRSETGAITRIDAGRVTADLVWQNIFRRASQRVFHRLTFENVTGKTELPLETKIPAETPRRIRVDLSGLRGWRIPLPTIVEGRNVEHLFQSKGNFVKLQEARFRFSEMEPGTLKIGRLTIQQPWLKKTFPNLRGTTALQESRVLLANIALDPEVVITSFSTELGRLAQGELKQKIELAVFEGKILAQAETRPQEKRLEFEASGNFFQINVSKLASFLALSEAAGGTIRDGNFSFRGSPQNVARSTTRLRLHATNFQWESRQWDSLVFGAELIDRRLQVHELELHQGKNELLLSGELILPVPPQKWWQSDFNTNISAEIDNLTDLSALLLPDFKYAAGKIHAAGSVRGSKEKFQGQLVVDGSRLQWRDAPIEELHATLRLNGNELQISNFNLFNDGDYVRGQGVVNILGPTQYWGTLRGSVDELGAYASILQKPIIPEPLAGGALLDWSGEGSAKGHSGKFMARLRKLRSLGASAALLHPLNADLEGSYAAGSMVFSKFALSDDHSSLIANIAVGNRALALQGIRLMHDDELWLEGDALLPLDVWKAWPNTSLATLLNDDVQSRVTLTAYNLELAEASRLTGWKFPIHGSLRGTITAEGALRELKTGGRLALTKAQIPLGTSGLTMTAVEGEATFSGQTAELKLTGKHPTGDLQIAGKIHLKDVRDVGLELQVRSSNSAILLFQPADDSSTARTTLHAALDLRVDGPASRARLSGRAQALLLDTHAIPDLAGYWSEPSRGGLPPPLTVQSSPIENWTLDVVCGADDPVPLKPGPGTAHGSLRLTGTGASPTFDGIVSFQSVAARTGENPFTVHAAVLSFSEQHPEDPAVDLIGSGQIENQPFFAWATGSLRSLIRAVDVPPSLTISAVNSALSGKQGAHPSIDSPFSIRLPSILGEGIRTYDWMIAEPPPPPPPSPEPAPEIAPPDLPGPTPTAP